MGFSDITLLHLVIFIFLDDSNVKNVSYSMTSYLSFNLHLLLRDGLVVSVSANHATGRGYASCPCHTKTIIKMVQTASLLGMQALG